MAERGGIDAWRQADALFDQWLDFDDAGREPWLAALDVDPDVRTRLQRLIEAHARPSAVLTTPASDLSGMRLGNWTLESELGRGGMAVVYRAVRSDGIARQDAALKVLTVGALGATGRDRFQREAEILARLNHPNITPLVDSGIAGDGTCWLAMPLVEGQRIDAWCDSHRLDARGVTKLFLQVCDAVAFAHRNLVIHRDLKPSNVLVEADGHVRLLDFGIGQFADAEGERTQTLWRALTPGYAAPEQLRGDPPTTAIDIYGLGALLHRLLTGRTPQSADDRTTTTRPSLLVRASGDAYHRHYVPLRSDLDRVLLKALAEEPGRRYPSVEAFADDLRRWLDGQPVLAERPGLGYRARKFINRHRVGVAAATLLAISMAAGIFATLHQAGLARQEAENARNQARRAVLVRDFLQEVFSSTQPAVGEVPTALEILDQGGRKARSEIAGPDPLAAADILMMIGNAQYNLGRFDQARQDLEEALALAGTDRDGSIPQRARIHWELGRLHRMRGASGQALAHIRASVALNETWDATANDRLRAKVSLGHALVLEDPAAAERVYREVLDELPGTGLEGSVRHSNALNGLIIAVSAMPDTADGTLLALEEERLSLVLEREGEDSDDYVHALAGAAMTFNRLGQTDRAERLARQAVDVSGRIFREPHFAHAVATCNLGFLLRMRSRFPEALPHFLVSDAIRRDLDIQDPHSEGCVRDMAYVKGAVGDHAGALEDLGRSRALLEEHGDAGSAEYFEACGLQASMHLRLGDPGSASRVLDGCPAAQGSDPAPDIVQAQAELLYEQGDAGGALALAAELRERRQPTRTWNDWMRSWMLWALASHETGLRPDATAVGELGDFRQAEPLRTCLDRPSRSNCLVLP